MGRKRVKPKPVPTPPAPAPQPAPQRGPINHNGFFPGAMAAAWSEAPPRVDPPRVFRNVPRF